MQGVSQLDSCDANVIVVRWTSLLETLDHVTEGLFRPDVLLSGQVDGSHIGQLCRHVSMVIAFQGPVLSWPPV